MATTSFIELNDLCKDYGTKTAVDHVNLDVYGGEVFGFLGPNGAGKTTTIKMIVGLLQPTSGTVRVAGYDMQQQPLRAKSASGYVPDTPNLYPKLSPRELLRFVGDLYAMDLQQISYRIEELLRLFSLDEVGDDLIDSYSHGMQQKTSLAAALIHDPKVLVLDEPTVGLDPKCARLIKDVLRQFADRGSAVFVTTHILEIAEHMCDRVGIIHEGKLIAVGTMDELRDMGRGETSLKDIFLSLTGGAEEAEIAEVLSHTSDQRAGSPFGRVGVGICYGNPAGRVAVRIVPGIPRSGLAAFRNSQAHIDETWSGMLRILFDMKAPQRAESPSGPLPVPRWGWRDWRHDNQQTPVLS